MKQEWYISINGFKEGPFSPGELKADVRVNPDTLVWKKGFKEWVQIRFIKELEFVFKDEPLSSNHEIGREPLSPKLVDEEGTLTIQQDPFPFLLWILILLLSLIYVLYLLKK
ncbi:DUF4339 domain-containing protein [Candidatus Protochlamydia sp. W-9]|uniref:DUF4339 domain-containing protein n=1 Tax=Candidatus Protochlamydia sp. W-9 TaxID=1785087 RepID=UPI00096A5843|nr:DUF4339 domain-containing protein [Candidatus Protochlamydia sp. W-9]